MNQESKLIKIKLGLLNLAEHLGNDSQACKVMGYSRDSFYCIKEMHDTRPGVSTSEVSRSKPILKNRVDPTIEEAVIKMAFDYRAFGQARTSNGLLKLSIFISPGGIRSVWLRSSLLCFCSLPCSLGRKRSCETMPKKEPIKKNKRTSI